jgi:hypothetical protein
MTVPGVARAQAPSHFTAHHLVQFEKGTDQDRQQLSVIPVASTVDVKPFEIAREDLNDDGSNELIIRSASDCGSNGCPTWVFEDRRGSAVAIRMWMPTLPRLAVTNEKVGAYRALAPLDDHGEIVVDEKPGPGFGKQIVYRMPVPSAAASTRPGILNPEACAGDSTCTEVPSFVAIITDFRLDLVRGSRVITATVRFVNKLDRTLVLGYVQGSGIVTDEQGNRYRALESTAVRGIGEIVAEQPNPKFHLGPGEINDTRFEFTLENENRALGTQYTVDLTVGELAPTPSEALVRLFGRDDPDVNAGGPHQWRVDKQDRLHFSGFTDAGISRSLRSTSTPAGAKLAGAYMPNQGGPSMFERLTFTSANEVTIDDGIAREVGTYVIEGRNVIITFRDGHRWVFTIDGKGCLIGDVVTIQAGLCRQ